MIRIAISFIFLILITATVSVGKSDRAVWDKNRAMIEKEVVLPVIRIPRPVEKRVKPQRSLLPEKPDACTGLQKNPVPLITAELNKGDVPIIAPD